MIDADALKKEWSMGDRCEDCKHNVKDCQYSHTLTLMDFCSMIDDAPTVGGWISVKDRLPEDGRDVLAYYNHPVESRIVPVNYYNDIWFDCVFNRPIDADIDYITHWMPFPEPPEEGDA